MFSVVIVDDEVWSIRGLEKLLPWSDLGFRVVGSFIDSVEAMESIRTIRPDVVFTDVRMPGLSGIDLIERIREAAIKVQFVVVSGYNDFEYAQAALHNGAFDYCLKPIDAEEGRNLLQRLAVHLRERRREADARTRQEILEDRFRGEFFRESAEPLAAPTAALSWAVIAAKGGHQELLETRLGEMSGLEYRVLIPDVDSTTIVLRGAAEAITRAATVLHDALIYARMCAGMGMASRDSESLAQLLQQAEMASGQSFVVPTVGLVRFNSERSDSLEKLNREITSALGAYNYVRACLLIDRLPRLFQEEGLGVYHVVVVWNRFVSAIEEWKTAKAAVWGAVHLNYDGVTRRFQTLGGLTAHMKRIIAIGIEGLRLTLDSSRYVNSRFIDLLEYVNRHYKKRLKLSDLAESFDLNFSYCCELFKRCTNGTFSEYVNNLRMKEALELARSGRYQLHQIAEMLGYTDYYYFSKRFKRYYGINPNQVKGTVDRAN